MLELINAARSNRGLSTLTLGYNDAAQLHAESSLESCGFGHWGIDGLKPYMRYTLQGGYQHNAENVVGMSYCYTADDGVRKLDMPRIVVRDAFEVLMGSSGHRKNILTPSHRKVNVGLALGTYRYVIVQHSRATTSSTKRFRRWRTAC